MARVLIADDDKDLCWIWSETLADAGHEVCVVHDGDTAAEALEQRLYDVLICDVIMPSNGAIVLAAMARLRQPDIKVMVVSGCLAMLDQPIETAVDDADAALRKPIDLDTLCQTVDDVLTLKAA